MAGGSRSTLGSTHDSQASADYPPHRLAGLWMLGERLVVHGLANLELLRFLTGLSGDGFIKVSRHLPNLSHLPQDFKGIRRED
ncbi:MAG: hypothetical protein RLZZ112_60 [Verrucomicrobiota bacterium]